MEAPMRPLLHAVLVVGLFGCSESPPEGDASGGGSGGGGTGGNAGSAGMGGGESGPAITQVLVTGALDVDTKSVTLTVDVVDPDGQGDIVGGKLYTKDKAKFLGPFSQVSAGTFSYSLSWQALRTG